MADTVLSIDDAWAGLGTTPLPKLISFTWKLENLFHQKLFAGSLSPNDYGNDVWAISLEVTVEAEHAVTEAEMDKMLTEDLSVVQIYANDSVAASTYEFQINGVYFIEDVSELDDRDGNNIIKLKYSGQKDGSGNTGNLIINSALAAL
jgi:hypothetical protein